MPTYRFRLNGRQASVVTWDPKEPLLYALRDSLGLHGPKFGCGVGHCGHCQLGPTLICRDGPVYTYETAAPWLEVREL